MNGSCPVNSWLNTQTTETKFHIEVFTVLSIALIVLVVFACYLLFGVLIPGGESSLKLCFSTGVYSPYLRKKKKEYTIQYWVGLQSEICLDDYTSMYFLSQSNQ